MTEPLPRKRFQVHLSTTIVMMFVAGGLILVNMPHQFADSAVQSRIVVYNCGWPYSAFGYSSKFSLAKYPQPESSFRRAWIYSYMYITIDLVIALLILFGAGLLCEWLIRRRSARKGREI